MYRRRQSVGIGCWTLAQWNAFRVFRNTSGGVEREYLFGGCSGKGI